MEAIDRLKLLSNMMELEPAEDAGSQRPSPRRPDALCISHAALPNGKQIRLLKTLLTSACERNCFYCPFRAGRDYRRLTFKPDELAQAYHSLHRAGAAQGIFLSSGIVAGGIRTQDALIATAEILRKKYQYNGYIHLKLMPGAEYDQVYRAMQLAERVSINLEAPNSTRLERLAPKKQFMDELLKPLQWVEQIRQSQPAQLGWKGRWPSTTTQFVVGAVGESDLELLSTTAHLHEQVRLARAYFSAFRPLEDTPLEGQPAESPVREHRLYQASFLLRDYHFDVEELPFNSSGNLPLEFDPKQAWAQANLQETPIELNQAEPETLLRIPGFGPRAVRAILTARRSAPLHSVEDLHRLGIRPESALPYILMDGTKPAQQLSLF